MQTIQLTNSVQKELEKNSKWKLMLYLQENGETPVYDLAKALAWTTGKTHAVVRSLVKSKTAKVKTTIKNGRAVKLVKLVE